MTRTPTCTGFETSDEQLGYVPKDARLDDLLDERGATALADDDTLER